MKSSQSRISALILCAGRGARSGLLYNKIFYYLGKKTVLEMTLDNFSDSLVNDITLVIAKEDEALIRSIVDNKYNVSLCYGGSTRFSSVKNGLDSLSDCDLVLIHDCARPYADKDLINRCIDFALVNGSAVAAVKSTDTLKTVSGNAIISNIDRPSTYHIQTPQAFDYKKIRSAYNSFFHKLENSAPATNDILGETNSAASIATTLPTDDSEVYSLAGFTPFIVEGSYDNIKITSNSDLYSVHDCNLRIGTGFDVHQTTEGNGVIIGGELISYNKSLLGHSDADVLTHAIMDSLLSAAGFSDIGVLFPDTDAKYKGISSLSLLRIVKEKLDASLFKIRSISCVVIAQKPKLSPHILNIRENLAKVLDVSPALINVSATTAETLGMIGEEKGIAASAVCLLEC